MTMLPHKNFTGEFPRQNAYDLAPGAAQSATNVDFTQGNLQGIKTRSEVLGVNAPGAKSIFIFDSATYSYYTWARDVDAVRGPIADDTYSRFYWADGTNFYASRGDLGGGGEPSSTNRYWVGVPEPTAAMTADTTANTFNINGYSPTTITVFAEGADNTRKYEVQPTKTVALNNIANYDVSLASANVPVNFLNQPVNGVAPSTTYKLAVEVAFSDGTNTYKAIVRPGVNTSSIPGELNGLNATLGSTVANSGTANESYTITLQLQAGSGYREARAYTYTYVNFWGEEGPPAKPLVMDIGENQVVTVKYTPPTANNYAPINRVRIYRTATGGTGTEYLFVKELTINTTNPVFKDDVQGSALGESIQTRDFYPPPQNLRGITVMPGGVLAGFSGNTVYFSQPYLPYAWKPSTTQALEHRVVGMCGYENGLYVTTTAYPVLITGYHPDTMSSQKIPAIQAGVSKGSICNAGPFAVYASHDGLVTIRGINASLDLSFKFFTREQWRNLYGDKLSQMRLNVHDGHLVAWFEDGTPGFLIRLDEVTPSFTKLTDPIYSSLVHPLTDALYVGSGSKLYIFKGGSARQAFTHWGKDYILPKQENLGGVQFVGGGTLTFTVYADGTQVFQTLLTIDQSGSSVIRLPSGFRARRWSFKIDGQADCYIYEMNVFTSPSELQGV